MVSHLCILTSAQPVSESTQIVNNGAYNVSWRVVGDVASFTVSARTTGWVGIGFSKDQLMVRPMQCVVPFYLSWTFVVNLYISLPLSLSAHHHHRSSSDNANDDDKNLQTN